MKKIFLMALMAVMSISLVSCGGNGKGTEKGNEETKVFVYPEWFAKGTAKTFENAYCISTDNPSFVKYYNKDISMDVYVDKKTGKDMFRVKFGKDVYSYEIGEVKENAGRIMAPIKQEYQRLRIRGSHFDMYMQMAVDITDSAKVRPLGFWVDLKDQKMMASTAQYNADKERWGSMLLIK